MRAFPFFIFPILILLPPVCLSACLPASARVVKVNAMARETDPKKRIVITGMGICSVFGNDYDVFYDKLLAGTSGREGNKR